MDSKYKGLIFYYKNIKDNDLYIKVLSSNDEIHSGIIYGGNSSKKKLIFQKGYFIDYTLFKKNKNSPPIFTAELSKPFVGNIINDKYKVYALLSMLSLINLSILEGQIVKGIYSSVFNLIDKIIINDRWIRYYCDWLFELLQIIGYEVNFRENTKKKYFDIVSQNFVEVYSDSTIIFPHNFFNHYHEYKYSEISKVFLIFESIFVKNHLDNINYKMPDFFIRFKKSILQRLENN